MLLLLHHPNYTLPSFQLYFTSRATPTCDAPSYLDFRAMWIISMCTCDKGPLGLFSIVFFYISSYDLSCHFSLPFEKLKWVTCPRHLLVSWLTYLVVQVYVDKDCNRVFLLRSWSISVFSFLQIHTQSIAAFQSCCAAVSSLTPEYGLTITGLTPYAESP